MATVEEDLFDENNITPLGVLLAQSGLLQPGSRRFIDDRDFETILKQFDNQYSRILPPSVRANFNAQQDAARIRQGGRTESAADLFDPETRQPNETGLEFLQRYRIDTLNNFQESQALFERSERLSDQGSNRGSGGTGGLRPGTPEHQRRARFARQATNRSLQMYLDDPHGNNPIEAMAARHLLEAYSDANYDYIPEEQVARREELLRNRAESSARIEESQATGQQPNPADTQAVAAANQEIGDAGLGKLIADFGRIGLRSFLGSNIISAGVDLAAGAQQVQGNDDGLFVKLQEDIDGIEQFAEGDASAIEKDSFAYDLASGIGFMASMMFGGPLAIAGKFTAKGAQRLGVLGATEMTVVQNIAAGGAQKFSQRFAAATGVTAGAANQTLDYLETARANGEDLEGSKYALAAAGGTILGATDAFLPAALAGRYGGPNGGNIIGRVLSGANRRTAIGRAAQAGVGEAAQEVLQGVGEQALARGIYDPERELFDFERAEREAQVGGTIGLLASVGADLARSSIGARARRATQRQADAAAAADADAEPTTNNTDEIADPVTADRLSDALDRAEQLETNPTELNLSNDTSGASAGIEAGQFDTDNLRGAVVGRDQRRAQRFDTNNPSSFRVPVSGVDRGPPPQTQVVTQQGQDVIQPFSTFDIADAESLRPEGEFQEADLPAIGGFTGTSREVIDIIRGSIPDSERQTQNAERIVVKLKNRIETMTTEQGEQIIRGLDNPELYRTGNDAAQIPERWAGVIANETRVAVQAGQSPVDGALTGIQKAIAGDGRARHEFYTEWMYDIIAAAEKVPSTAEFFSFADGASQSDLADPSILERRRLPEASPAGFANNIDAARRQSQIYETRGADPAFHGEQIAGNGLPADLTKGQQRAVDAGIASAAKAFERGGLRSLSADLKKRAGSPALSKNPQAQRAFNNYADRIDRSLSDGQRFTPEEFQQNTATRENSIKQRALERSKLAASRLRAKWFDSSGVVRTDEGTTTGDTTIQTRPDRQFGAPPLDDAVGVQRKKKKTKKKSRKKRIGPEPRPVTESELIDKNNVPVYASPESMPAYTRNVTRNPAAVDYTYTTAPPELDSNVNTRRTVSEADLIRLSVLDGNDSDVLDETGEPNYYGNEDVVMEIGNGDTTTLQRQREVRKQSACKPRTS